MRPRRRAEADASRAPRFSHQPRKHDLVAVLEKRALLAVGQLDRAFTVPGELDQAALAACGAEPLIVPDAKRSPGRATAPLAVACASCCATFQYMSAKRWSARSARRRDAPLAHPLRLQLDGEPNLVRPRFASRADTAAARGSCTGPATRNGSSASSVTIHGEIVVANDLPEKRPERLILPRLNVARAPIVDQHQPEDVLVRVGRRRSARRARCPAR